MWVCFWIIQTSKQNSSRYVLKDRYIMHLRQNIFDPLRFSSRKTRSGIPEAVQLPAYRERPRVISFQGACVGVIRKALLVAFSLRFFDFNQERFGSNSAWDCMESNPPQSFINFNQELVDIPLSHMLSVLPEEVVAHSVLSHCCPQLCEPCLCRVQWVAGQLRCRPRYNFPDYALMESCCTHSVCDCVMLSSCYNEFYV